MKHPKKHSDKLKEIPSNEWIKLFSQVKKLDDGVSPGYYPFNIENSDWKNIDIEKIDWVNT